MMMTLGSPAPTQRLLLTATCIFLTALSTATFPIDGGNPAVDVQGDTWSNFDTPRHLRRAFIQNSLGCLHYAGFHDHDDDTPHVQLEVYALKNYANKEWILKHRVGSEDIEEFKGVTQIERCFQWIAIDPEWNSIFFVDGSDKTLRRYDMGRRQVTQLRTLGEGDKPYLPYVPLYSELESLRK